jgi:hypothetical protein
VLGERIALADEARRHRVPEDGWLELEVRWPAPTLVHVKDEQGRELDGIRVFQVAGWESSIPANLWQGLETREMATSPFNVPPSETCAGARRTLFAIRAGFAWGSVQLDLQRSGDKELRLRPAGEIELALLGCPGEPGTILTMDGFGARTRFTLDLASQRITGLAPGHYSFQATNPEASLETRYRGQARGIVTAGGSTRVALHLRSDLALEVPLSGVVVVPPAWNLDSFELVLESLDLQADGRHAEFRVERSTMTLVDAKPGEYRWSVPAAPAGGYSACIEPLTYTTVFTACPTVPADARITIPPPREIFVRCIEAGTEQDVPNLRLYWNLRRAEGVHGGSLESATWDETLELHRFRAPEGVIEVGCFSHSAWRPAHGTVEAGAGRNELTLRLERACGLRLKVREGDNDFHDLLSLRARLVPAEGQPDASGWRIEDGGITLSRNDPGLYTLTVSAPYGFEPIPDASVRLAKGIFTEHVVELVRLP